MDATLLLNASNEPLTVVPWTRAVLLVLGGKADIAHVHDDVTLRSAGGYEMPLPSIVRLRRYARFRVRPRIPAVSRQRVLDRDGHRCAYCRQAADTIDHIVPRRDGGPTSWTNLVACCRSCNQIKGARTPDQVGWGWPAARPPLPAVPGVKIVDPRPDWHPYLASLTPEAV